MTPGADRTTGFSATQLRSVGVKANSVAANDMDNCHRVMSTTSEYVFRKVILFTTLTLLDR